MILPAAILFPPRRKSIPTPGMLGCRQRPSNCRRNPTAPNFKSQSGSVLARFSSCGVNFPSSPRAAADPPI
jgi:hypothetical protein